MGLGRGRTVGGGRSGIAGGGGRGSGVGDISPLSLVAGAKKLFQDVSGDALNVNPTLPHNANVLTGRPLPHDCATADGGPDGSSDGAHGLSGTSLALIISAIHEKCLIANR
jgi:hypothetical protein